jgi:hypothetical protein
MGMSVKRRMAIKTPAPMRVASMMGIGEEREMGTKHKDGDGRRGKTDSG